jgi:hypothetical protein
VSFVTFPPKLGPVHHYRVIVLRVLDLVLLDAVDWQILPQPVQRAAVYLAGVHGAFREPVLGAFQEGDSAVHWQEGFGVRRGGEDVLVLTLIDVSRYLLLSTPSILF